MSLYMYVVNQLTVQRYPLCHFKTKEFNMTFPCSVQKLFMVRKNIKANLQNSN